MDIKDIIEKQFGLNVDDLNVLGQGHDSVAYLVNNEYIFKIKYSSNKKKGYQKEKTIYDFLDKYLETNIQIPKIEYFYVSDTLQIMGYKEIKGNFFNPQVYDSMTNEEKDILKNDIANFLKQLHSLDTTEISEYVIDNKQNVLEEYQLLRDTIYDDLTNIEKNYIESFMERLSKTTIFNGRKCLCHNDFSCNHLLLDSNNRLCGIIDFGDAGIVDEYSDFMYLLEDSEEEVGVLFGEEILKIYGDIDIDMAKEYQDVTEQYYPIEIIVYGIKNNKPDFINKGRQEIYNRYCSSKRK